MAKKKYQITQLQQDNSLLILHPETDADIVAVEKGTGKYQGDATNVQDALEEVYDLASTGGVTGVKGNAESTYRTGNVNLTPANIGAEAAFTDGSATIASESNGIVTLKSGVAQNGGAIANTSGSDITLGAAAKKGVATSVGSSSTDDDLATAKAVNDAINGLPTPMQFKGSVGSGGTIEWSALPSAASSNEGYTYKVITQHTTTPVCEVGDTIISNGSSWVVIPSGDEPSGTVTSVAAQGASGSHLSVSGSPITSSGTLEISIDSGYSIPSDTKQGQWDGKYDKPSGGIPDTDLSSGVQASLGKADTALQTHQTITASGDATGTSNNGALALTLANSGVTAGTYSVVSVDAKGRVTNGAQLIEVGTSGQTTPSNSLAVGGIFFKEL